MRRHQLTSGVQGRPARASGGAGRVLGALGRIGAVTLAASVIGVPLAFLMAPVPAGADAVTLCLPGIGPLQQFSRDLDGEHAQVVRIHELMHVQQCRSMGAAAWYLTYGSPRGRMRLEAEAFCAEIDVLARRGADREALLEPRVELLHGGYGNRGALSLDEVRELMRATCERGAGGRAAATP